MSIAEQISKAIAAHAYWKHRLRIAIAIRNSDLTVAQARMDHTCAFGQWLQALPAEIRRSRHCSQVAELHRLFHDAAADVLAMAFAGRTEDANRELALEGSFSQASERLIAALRAWKTAASAGALGPRAITARGRG
jgi:hypothetical protein